MNSGHTENGAGRSKALLKEGQRIAGTGYFEWQEGHSQAYCSDGIFHLLELTVPQDNLLPLDLVTRQLPPADLARVQRLRELLHGQQRFSFQHQLIKGDGRVREMQCQGECRYADNGRLQAVTGSWQDITSLNRETPDWQAAALMRAEQLANIGSYRVNFSTGKTFYSDNMYRIYGYQPGEVPAEEKYFSPLIHPEDRADVMALYERVMARPEDHEINFRIVQKDGSIRHLHANGKFYTDDNNEQVLDGAVMDVSEWRQMEEDLDRQNYMLQQAEETASLGSWKYNFVTKQAFYSDSLFRIFGYEGRPFENDINRIFERIDPEDIDTIRNTYQKTIEDGISRKADFRLTMPDGTLRFFTSNGRMAQNKAGQQIIIGTVQDITEQHLLSSQLAAQHDLVQKLIDSSVNCILVMDREKRYTLWNQRCEDLYGIRREAAIGKTLRELFEGFDVSWFEEAADRALAGEKVMIAEWPSVVTGKYYEFHLQPLTDAAGTVDQVFVLIHDITELKQLNETIKKQKEFAEAVIDHSAAAIFVFDTEQRLLSWNKQCEQFYNQPKEAVLGMTLEEVFPDADMSRPVERLRRALKGETVHYEAEQSNVVDKYYDSYVIPMKNESGAVERVLCILNDVTELVRKSEEVRQANQQLEEKNKELADRTYFLETLLDASFENIAVYDQDLRVLEMNKAVLDRWGYHKGQVVGKDVYELFPGIEGTMPLENLKEVLKGGAVADYEARSLKDGRHFRSTLIPLRHNDGATFAVLAIGYDITDIKKTMEELETLNNQLAAKNHELNRINSELASFSYVASHDLQEPLRKIQAFISLLLTRDVGQLSDTSKDYFDRIQTAASRMQQMIDGLLSFSRTNTAAKTFETADLNELVSRICLTLQGEIKRRNAKIDTGRLHQLTVIPLQFEQLLEHLVGNALKFCAADTQPSIFIESDMVAGRDIQEEVAQRNKDYYRISVRDNGIGFDMDDAERIFQLFQRLNGKSEYPGTGIGLAICRRIAQNHNGFITADSKPGEGSTFHIFIPQEEHASRVKQASNTFAE